MAAPQAARTVSEVEFFISVEAPGEGVRKWMKMESRASGVRGLRVIRVSVLIMVPVVSHLTDEHRGEEHEDEGL